MNELLKESKLNPLQLVSVGNVSREPAVLYTQREYEWFAMRPVAVEAESNVYAIRVWDVELTEKYAFTKLGKVITWLTKIPGVHDAS